MDNMKKIDLIFFTILAVLAELITSLSFKYLRSGFYFSFAILIFIVFSIRWGKIAIISLVLSGIPLLFTDPIGGSFQIKEIWQGILVHIVVNGFAVIPIAIYGKRDRNKIAKSPLYLFIYVVTVFLSLSLGMEIVLLIINRDPIGAWRYFSSRIFTLILTFIILLILLHLKTKLICDMTRYLEEEVIEDCFNEILEKGESETNERNTDETRERQENFA